jgi:hypothetical protein
MAVRDERRDDAAGLQRDHAGLSRAEDPGAPHRRDDSVLSRTHALDVRDVRRRAAARDGGPAGFYGDLGAFSPGAVNVARDFLGADRLLFGSDAPFDATGGRSSILDSIAAVRDSMCTEEEKQNIFTTNVERFFNLPRA